MLKKKTSLFLKKKTFKINYCSYTLWRKVFLLKYNALYQKREKIIFDRSSVIPQIFINKLVSIYSGNIFHNKNINRWHVGYKFGELTWNRKLALYKVKQLKKKKKK